MNRLAIVPCSLDLLTEALRLPPGSRVVDLWAVSEKLGEVRLLIECPDFDEVKLGDSYPILKARLHWEWEPV